MNKIGALLRIVLLVATLFLGGFLGTWMLKDYNTLNMMIFFGSCSVLGVFIYKIDEIVLEKFSSK